MQLLTPKIIKDVKKEEEEKNRLRVSALAREESETVFRLNLLRQEEEEYLERKKVRETPDQTVLIVTKSILEREVDGLENRKRVALEPIEKQTQEAKDLMAQAKKSAEFNADWSIKLTTQENGLKDREKSLSSREEKIKNEEIHTADRSSTVVKKEAEIKRQMEQFAEEKIAYALKVQQDFEAIAQRESNIENEVKIIAIERERFTKRDHEQNERERGLNDKYHTLERAIAEHNRNK